MSCRLNDNCLSTNRSVILHFWKQGHLSIGDIVRLTRTLVRTIRCNIGKIEKYGTMNYRGGYGQPRKIKHKGSIKTGNGFDETMKYR